MGSRQASPCLRRQTDLAAGNQRQNRPCFSSLPALLSRLQAGSCRNETDEASKFSRESGGSLRPGAVPFHWLCPPSTALCLRTAIRATCLSATRHASATTSGPAGRLSCGRCSADTASAGSRHSPHHACGRPRWLFSGRWPRGHRADRRHHAMSSNLRSVRKFWTGHTCHLRSGRADRTVPARNVVICPHLFVAQFQRSILNAGSIASTALASESFVEITSDSFRPAGITFAAEVQSIRAIKFAYRPAITPQKNIFGWNENDVWHAIALLGQASI